MGHAACTPPEQQNALPCFVTNSALQRQRAAEIPSQSDERRRVADAKTTFQSGRLLACSAAASTHETSGQPHGSDSSNFPVAIATFTGRQSARPSARRRSGIARLKYRNYVRTRPVHRVPSVCQCVRVGSTSRGADPSGSVMNRVRLHS